jgi:hypothetical protein
VSEESPGGRAVLRTGNANHFRGILAVNGKLTLTATHLTFRAGRLNLQTYEQSFPLDAIQGVEPRRGLALVGDGLAVLLPDGEEERFVVFGRREWLREIQGARDALVIRMV